MGCSETPGIGLNTFAYCMVCDRKCLGPLGALINDRLGDSLRLSDSGLASVRALLVNRPSADMTDSDCRRTSWRKTIKTGP